MRLFYLKITLLAGCLILGGAVFVVAQDNPFSELIYPIPELGNCSSKDACDTYCDKSENMKACLDFAEAHGLLSEEEIEMGRRMLALGITEGPGGCRSQEECEAYCDEIEHIKECIIFAEKNNLIPPDELEEARKVIQAIDKGFIPPKCKGKKECDIYCSKPENMEECIAFGQAAGLIPPDEIAETKKMLEAIRKGAKPPACAGKKECDIYCSQVEHMEECMTFAIAAGFMPPEEIENAKKTLEALKQGVRPPNCQGKEECDVYCSQSEHMEECMEFGIAAGFISPEEIEGARGALRAIKQGIRPPDCQGKEECDIYCSQPEHMGECMEFSIAAGFMPPEDIENVRKTLEAIKKGAMPPNCRGEEECNIYCSQPEHQIECINFSEAAGFMTPEDAARAKEMAELGIVGGPGGCQGEEECNAFCQDPANMETCINFSVKTGDMSQEEADKTIRRMRALSEGGPGGCKTNEECNAVCQNPTPEFVEECINFFVKTGDMTPEEAQQILENMRMMQEGPPPAPEGMQSPEEIMGPSPQEMESPMLPPEEVAPPSQEIIPPPAETPPSTESPQSFFDLFRNFLASLIPF